MFPVFKTTNLYTRFIGFGLLLLLIYVNYPVECDPCTILNLPKDEYCTAQIDCQKYVDFDVKEWDCITHKTTYRRRNYNYYSDEYSITYDENYNLIINVIEPDETNIFRVNVDHVKKLTLEDGDLLTVPEDVYKMTKLTEIKVSGNKISTINFKKFLPMPVLNKIILNHNNIKLIDTDESFDSRLSNVQIIDASFNFIEVLPNSFVSHFIHLKHLNLSHNMIRSMGILTFEGITQLETLDMSHNRLFEVGNTFARFVNLIELSISNNNISKFIDYNFATLTKLEKLNASSNDIVSIENSTFLNLIKLEVLDLGHNKLETISKHLFSSNTNLRSLSLLDNRIQFLEDNSFKDTQISEFSVKNNRLSGAIEKYTFKGINVTELNLSLGNITCIKDEAFADMLDLKSLNLSSNAISNISYLAFSTLVSLNTLDLSHNQLKELYFETNSLKNISKLYACHNNISKITKKVFEHFTSLEELDLSFNDIKEIEPQSFLKLNNIKVITLKGSHFVNSLETKSLEGLTSLENIDMSEMRITCFQNQSFSGLISLTKVNASFGQLAEIQYNAFLGTNSLEIIILSNNQLRYFHLNTSTISQIQEIYLNNNFLRNVSGETFSRLTLLRNLNLANNDIIRLSSNAFQHLNSLMILDLSSNERMKIIGNPFQNLSKLYSLSLQYDKTEITFENSTATIEVLGLQSCGISTINKVSIFNVHGLNYLNLSMNEINVINKDSFRNMPLLVSLDLSLNRIVYIQPGSFLHVKKLMVLNLFGNNLSSIQFGVFDGTLVLRDLNLSSNVLSDFDVKLLPVVTKLSLDDNVIAHLNFKDFFDTKISELSIGGNQISCIVLAELKASNFSEKFKHIVTAKTLNYHSENVNGISCQTSANNTAYIMRVSDNSSVNINPLISLIRNALNKFDKSLQTIGENSNKTDELRYEAKNIVKSLESFIESSNKNQINNNEYLTKLTDISNDSNVQLGEIKKYLKYLTDSKNEFETGGGSITKNPIDDQYIRLEFQKMLKQENDALREEFKNALASISKAAPIQESLISHDKGSNDMKAVFYFMAICLALMLAVYIGNIVFSHVMTQRRSYNSHTHNSATAISNSIEMME